jgi:hypothetical protein
VAAPVPDLLTQAWSEETAGDVLEGVLDPKVARVVVVSNEDGLDCRFWEKEPRHAVSRRVVVQEVVS